MLHNKRAFTLEEAIKLTIASVLIVVTLVILKPFLFPSHNPDKKSLPDFEENLVPKITKLAESDKKLDKDQINYFLGAEKSIIGFNKIWDSARNLQIIGLKVDKPSSCNDKACLCFFERKDLLAGKPLKPCTKFDKVSYFLLDTDGALDDGYGNPITTEQARMLYRTIPTISAPDTKTSPLPEAFTETEYKYLRLRGMPYARYENIKDVTIYIEKYENARGEIIIYLAPINEDTKEKIAQRKQYIDSIGGK